MIAMVEMGIHGKKVIKIPNIMKCDIIWSRLICVGKWSDR